MDASVNRIKPSKDERSFLISIKLKTSILHELNYSMEELKMLVKTAGGICIGSRIVRRDSIDPAYIIGRGFLDELSKIIIELDIKMLVFDLNSLRPAQIRNLEDKLKCRVIGRQEVILDIFAMRAKSSEAKIQVELAQLRYILPRLQGLGGILSRLGGGIGTRGPGEKMLETDRRHIKKRISVLTLKQLKIREHRERNRKSRKNILCGAVVGYTNAGKSTLINSLANDDLYVENMLFATLDSFTRTVYLQEGKNTLLTDTVGFIRNLPSDLVESFRSTLEEINESDYLIHVVDINSTDIEGNIKTVNSELAALECSGKPLIIFFNKIDLMKDEELLYNIRLKYPDSLSGSAMNKNGLDELKSKIAVFL